MRKELQYYFLAITVLIGTTGCPVPENFPPVFPPSAIGLRVAVKNMTDIPAAVTIRHARFPDHSVQNGSWEYTDWSEIVSVKPHENRSLNHETIQYRYQNEKALREMTGFILWQEPYEGFPFDTELPDFSSSFELELTREDKTIRLAGYKTQESGFAGTELGCLKIERDDREYDYYTNLAVKDQRFRIEVPVLIRAELIINPDGTYSFEYNQDDVSED
jgi:hypothetical protein